MFLVYIGLSWFIKLLIFTLKVSGQGRGTALPGLIIEKYFPFIIPYILKQSPYTILITGTNGKTTTRTILSNVLQTKDGVIQNRSGSNLKRGILSEIISQSNFWGKVSAKYAIFEVEEATIPKLTQLLKPKQIIVTNLYRDQLDAYGEIDRTQKFIQEAINNSPQAEIILNGDDPRVRNLDTKKNKATHYFQIDDPLKYRFNYEGETQVGLLEESFTAQSLKINPDLSTSFEYLGEKITLNIPGYYHVYNVLASIASAEILNIKLKDIVRAIENTKPAFGRGEIVQYMDKNIHILLVKNPAGFNLNLDLLTHIANSEIIFILNDKIADGKDVSWIWDSQLEILNKIKPKTIICSGTRASDMLLRVKYALPNLKATKIPDNYFDSETKTTIILAKKTDDILDFIKKSSSTDFYILATYTAMLGIRKIILGNSLNV